MRRLVLAATAVVMLFGVTLGLISWAYRHDVQQLQEFYDKRDSVELQLRTYEICLDMQENPNNWTNKALRPPCFLDTDALHKIIPDYEGALLDWKRVVAQRKQLIDRRRAGPFAFIQRMAE
jgi:hypothetical protein